MENTGKVLTNNMIQKVRNLIREGIEVLEKIKELRDNLNEHIKDIESQTGINKRILRKTIRSAYTVKQKGNRVALEEEKEVIDLVESLID